MLTLRGFAFGADPSPALVLSDVEWIRMTMRGEEYRRKDGFPMTNVRYDEGRSKCWASPFVECIDFPKVT